MIKETIARRDIDPEKHVVVDRAVYEAMVDAVTSALDILPHVVKFLKFQKPGREFWPNREAAEAAVSRLEHAKFLAEPRP